MPRAKNDESFRLFKRRLGGRELFYARFLDEEGTIIATRSMGTDNERRAIKKALDVLKTIPKKPLKKDPLFIDFLLEFWQRDSEYVQLRELDGHRLSTVYLEKTHTYIKSLAEPYEPFKKLRLSQITPRILDKWKLTVGQSDASRKGINHAVNGLRVALRWAFRQGYISADPTASFTYIAYHSKEKGSLSTEEIGKIEALNWPDLRQKAALILGFSCGLRRCEVRALR
jgi:integrase